MTSTVAHPYPSSSVVETGFPSLEGALAAAFSHGQVTQSRKPSDWRKEAVKANVSGLYEVSRLDLWRLS